MTFPFSFPLLIHWQFSVFVSLSDCHQSSRPSSCMCYSFSIYYSFLQVSSCALIFATTLTLALDLYTLYFSKTKGFYYFLLYLKKSCLPGLFIVHFIYSELCFKLVYIYHTEVCMHSNFKKQQLSSSLKKVLIQTFHSSERLVFSLQNATLVNYWVCSFFFL